MYAETIEIVACPASLVPNEEMRGLAFPPLAGAESWMEGTETQRGERRVGTPPAAALEVVPNQIKAVTSCRPAENFAAARPAASTVKNQIDGPS